MNKIIPVPVNEPLLDGNEKKYINECIDTGWISSEGPFVKRFEDEFSSYVDRNHGIAVANGSLALDIAVKALEIGKGDEVILPTFTIVSCANSVVNVGATPVVVDCDPNSWNMIASQVEAKITKNTKAIMLVHLYGLPVDLDPILELAKKHDLKIIEDAAEMHGQTYKGKKCGSFGDISIFSFYPNKHITTGEGGMLVTDSPKLAERCRSIRNLCFQANPRFVHEEMGLNARMTNMQAALGVAQLEKIEEKIIKKRYIGYKYDSLLADIPTIHTPLAKTEYAENIYWVYGIVLKDDYPADAKEIANRLREYKIGSRPFFWPMHQQPIFQKMGLFKDVQCPNAEKIAKRGFYIPSGLGINDEKIEYVAKILKEVLK